MRTVESNEKCVPLLRLGCRSFARSRRHSGFVPNPLGELRHAGKRHREASLAANGAAEADHPDQGAVVLEHERTAGVAVARGLTVLAPGANRRGLNRSRAVQQHALGVGDDL